MIKSIAVTEKISQRLKLVHFLVFVCIIFLFPEVPSIAHEQPAIGLIYNKSQTESLWNGSDKLGTYRAALEKSGAKVIPLSPLYDADFLTIQKNQLDGLLVPGGIDIDPALYNQQKHIKLEEFDRAWDRFELAMIESCFRQGLPILGICRGHQLLNVYFNGTLYQDIPSEYSTQKASSTIVPHRRNVGGDTKYCFHFVNLKRESFLYKWLGEDRIRTNTYHHQAVKETGRNLFVSAVSDDGLVEGVEYSGIPCVVGVQFHPEKLLPEDPRFEKIFKGFIEEVLKAKNERVKSPLYFRK